MSERLASVRAWPVGTRKGGNDIAVAADGMPVLWEGKSWEGSCRFPQSLESPVAIESWSGQGSEPRTFQRTIDWITERYESPSQSGLRTPSIVGDSSQLNRRGPASTSPATRPRPRSTRGIRKPPGRQ